MSITQRVMRAVRSILPNRADQSPRYSNPKYKRTTTASRRDELRALDRYVHVSCPPHHNRLHKGLGLTKGTTYYY